MVSSVERVVGTSVPRVDAPAKITGKEHYAGDLALPGLLHARLVLSSEVHARITDVDTAAALAVPGVVAVVVAEELPFAAEGGSPRARESLARGEVLYAGHPVAAVLAEDEMTAAEAAALVTVAYEPLPVVLDLRAAMDPASPLVRVTSQATEDAAEAAMHGIGGGHVEESAERLSANVSGRNQTTAGDAAAGFAAADAIVEGIFRTSWVHQSYIEPQTCVAAPDGLDGVVVYASTQGIFRTRTVVAETLGLPQHRVRLVPMAVGGGFGGKFGLIEPLTAALALKVGRPVKLVFSRSEEMVTANPTPAAIIELRLGGTKDGLLTALQARLIVDTGAFPNSPMGGMAFAISNCYRIPNLDIHGYEVMTNRLGPGAYRAPGNPQASFAMEQMVDRLAKRLGLDPLALRVANVPVEGDARPDGRPWPRIGLKECLERLQQHPLWQQRTVAPDNGRYREGVGVGLGGWRGGLEPAASQCQVEPEGTILVVVGAVDLTGTYTAFQQIAAETLGVDLDHVRIAGADSSNAPYSGGAGGSKIVYTVGQAVQRAAQDAKEQILQLAATVLEAAVEDLEIAGDRVRVRGVPAGTTSELSLKAIGNLTSGFGARHAPIAGRGKGAQTANAPGFAAHLARVRVDTETGQVDVLDYVATQDVGRAINPAAVDGQIIGAIAQGIGWGLLEHIQHDEIGQVVTGSLMDYAVPRAHVMPQIETVLLEVPAPDGPFGARGVGEPPVIPVAAAIANAIHHATGATLADMPITPERLWQALRNGTS